MPDGSVDHVITDPPYEAEAHNLQRRKTGTRVDGSGAWQRRGGATVQAPINFAPMSEALRVAVGVEIARIARRWVLVFCQSEAAMLWRSALEPLKYKRTCVWVKPDGMPQLTGDRPGMGYESIVCAHRKGRSVWNGGGRTGVFVHMSKDYGGGAGIRADHPTTKPQSLMCELIGLFTDPGETIMDPFSGSGSTGVAALRLGRSFIGMEKDPAYYETAHARLSAESSGITLHAARAGQVPLFGAVR
jgi:site-specific DNA-methyltransferase (adenine-specific)